MATCRKCGKGVEAGKVRYVSPSEYYCAECFLGMQGKPRNTVRTGKSYDVEPAVYTKLVCEKCGFLNKFRTGSSAVRRCAYCSSEALRAPESTAAKILEETDDDFTRE